MTKSLFIAVLTSLVLFSARSAGAAGVKVVVHASNGIESVSKARVADLFLKRVTRWDSGRAVTPVDLSEKSSTRESFSRDLLLKEVAWVKSYWQKMIFSGRATPPAELSSESEVLELIRTNPDAIGYVSEAAVLPASVKTVPVAR